MKNQQYTIYLKSSKQWIPVSKEEFDNYYRDINTYRRKQQEHGRCICPASKRYLCDMDCYSCPYQKGGDQLSLDYTVNDDDGNEKSWLDSLEDDTPSPQSQIEENEMLLALHQLLSELDPESSQICQLIMNGCSERESSKAMNMPRNTFVYKRNKLLVKLATLLEPYL